MSGSTTTTEPIPIPIIPIPTLAYSLAPTLTHSPGLILARALGILPADLRLLAVNVCDDRDYFLSVIGTICSEFDQRYDTNTRIEDQDMRDWLAVVAVALAILALTDEERRLQLERTRDGIDAVDPDLAGIRVIAYTSAGMREDLAIIRQNGFDGHLVKPVAKRLRLASRAARKLSALKSSAGSCTTWRSSARVSWQK